MITSLHLANTLHLEILGGNYVNLDSRWVVKNASNSFTRLYYVQSGFGYLYTPAETIPLEPGFAYLIPAGTEFGYKCPKTLSKLFFHVTITNPEGFDLLSTIPRICRMPYPQEALEHLKKLHHSKNYYELLELNTNISQFVIECIRSVNLPPFPAKSYSQIVMQAITFMQRNVNIQLTGQQIADAAFTSVSCLRKCFKKETGLTLGAYLDRLVFYRASQLLRDPDFSIGEISQRLGFCDQFYFSRRFKEQFAQTPSQFRNHLR